MPVYFIFRDGEGAFATKIGVSEKIDKRRRDLQTASPDELKLVGFINTQTPYVLEKQLHAHFARFHLRGEWFNLQPADVLPILQRAGIDGYVGKQGDAFEIVGRDKDAVPEYAGVWEWGDLELYECCPFCGCLCGMYFQDASWMYHCRACDTLTTFEALSPPEGPDERDPWG